MNEPRVVEETIEMISTGLILTVPSADNDNRTFITCEDCKESFLLVDPAEVDNTGAQIIESLSMLPRIMLALHHITQCPFDGPKVSPK